MEWACVVNALLKSACLMDHPRPKQKLTGSIFQTGNALPEYAWHVNGGWTVMPKYPFRPKAE
jgi:hypothetical protein